MSDANENENSGSSKANSKTPASDAGTEVEAEKTESSAPATSNAPQSGIETKKSSPPAAPTASSTEPSPSNADQQVDEKTSNQPKSSVVEAGSNAPEVTDTPVSDAEPNLQSQPPPPPPTPPKPPTPPPTTSKSKQNDLNRTRSMKSTQSHVSQASRQSRHSRSRTKLEKAEQARIGLIGAGHMANCIVRGLLGNTTVKINSKQLFVSAKTTKNFDYFKNQGIVTSTRPYEIFAKLDCDIIFLVMHGYVIRNCFKMGGSRPFPFTTNYIPWKRKDTIVLSLVGGIMVPEIRQTLLNPEQTQKYRVAIHRIVLNASVAYNLGFGALDIEMDSKKCHPVIRDVMMLLLTKVEYVDGSLMDALCALSGCGIAFVYYFVNAMATGAFKMGINKEKAHKLATKTLYSASMTLLEANKSPSDLRDAATSPSGPSIYGLMVMDQKDFCSGVSSAVEAAYRRIVDLAENEPLYVTKAGGSSALLSGRTSSRK